jgi:plastocyanin
VRGQRFGHTFPEPGTHPFVYREHRRQGMRGAVIVET